MLQFVRDLLVEFLALVQFYAELLGLCAIGIQVENQIVLVLQSYSVVNNHSFSTRKHCFAILH